MGTEKGLYQLNDEGKIIRTVYKTDGLPDDNIYALAGDKYGNMWISHNKGISCMRKAGDYIHYYKSDGLQENEFNTNSVFTTADCELFFGGVNGVSSFYPESILKLSQAPGLLVTGLKIKDVEWSGDTAVWNLQHLQLPYFKNDLSIEFTALGMRTPEQYNYQYRMLGLEENWINSANHRAARYVLPPGTYTFELSAQGSFNKDAVASRRIKITIQPPFWQTKLFLFSAFVLLAAIVILLTRYFSGLKLKRRIEQLERKRAIDEERLRISREMHDDLGSGLTQITMLSESAKGKTFNDEQLEKIASTSRKLVTDMSEIIWSMNPSQVSAGHLFAYLREQLHGLLESSGISYTIDFPEQGLDYELNNGQKRNLLLVTKEIVHNAIKHSGSNRVNVSAIIKNKNLEFTVADNGHGFDHSLHHNGNGLKNIKRRIEELKGHLDIESSANGSRFFYRISLQV